MAKSDGTMTMDDMDADTAATPESDAGTDEARQLATDLARSMFLAMQKVDSEEPVDQKSDAFKEKWAAERPRMMKIARFTLRRLTGKGYEIAATNPPAPTA